MIIYRVVQALLLCLLIYVAYIFQNSFALMGRPEKFISSIIAAIVIQLLLIYPIYRLAWRDAGVEIEGSAVGLTTEALAALRKKRLLGDLWKFSAVAFFLAFVTLVPDAKKAAGAPIGTRHHHLFVPADVPDLLPVFQLQRQETDEAGKLKNKSSDARRTRRKSNKIFGFTSKDLILIRFLCPLCLSASCKLALEV